MRLEANSSPVPSVRNSALSTSLFQPCEMLKRGPRHICLGFWSSESTSKKSVLLLAAKCVVNFYNSNRKLWQVAVIVVEFVCVSYHLEGTFIHKAIQRVSDSLGLGWVWETAFFFFFAFGTSAQMILLVQELHLEKHYCDHSPWPCVPGGKWWSGRCGVSL